MNGDGVGCARANFCGRRGRGLGNVRCRFGRFEFFEVELRSSGNGANRGRPHGMRLNRDRHWRRLGNCGFGFGSLPDVIPANGRDGRVILLRGGHRLSLECGNIFRRRLIQIFVGVSAAEDAGKNTRATIGLTEFSVGIFVAL